MSIRILKKALGLLIVDIVIIIGIFVLQFRTDSNIIKKIGNLQVTLEAQDVQGGVITYKNKARISYNGILFFFDDQNPALIKKDGAEAAIQLMDVEQAEPLSITLKFTDDIMVTFELASEDLSASLAILSELPDGITDLSIPYSYASNMTVQKAEKDSVILAGKRGSFRAMLLVQVILTLLREIILQLILFTMLTRSSPSIQLLMSLSLVPQSLQRLSASSSVIL